MMTPELISHKKYVLFEQKIRCSFVLIMNYVSFCHIFVGFHCFHVVLYVGILRKVRKARIFVALTWRTDVFLLTIPSYVRHKNGHNKAMNKRQSRVFAV